jgi:Tfp pilus assembly protein PilO
MNKISKEKKQQIIAVLIAAVVLTGCLWFFVIQGQTDRIKDRTGQIEATEKKIKDATELKGKATAVESDLAAKRKELDVIEDTMASGDLYSWVIFTINNFRKAHRVEVRNFSREDVTVVGVLPEFPYKAAKYTITGTAYYHDLGRFIAEFENEFPYFHIRNIDMAPTDASSEEEQRLGFRMEIVALIKPVPGTGK